MLIEDASSGMNTPCLLELAFVVEDGQLLEVLGRGKVHLRDERVLRCLADGVSALT